MGGMAGNYDMEGWINDGKEGWAQTSTLETWGQFHSLAGQIRTALNAAFTPNPDHPPFYCDSPFIYTDTEPKQVVKNQEAYDKFLQHDLVRMVEKHLDTLSGMASIYIDCGTNDSNIVGARKLHEKLNSLGVEHVYQEFSGDHTCCVMNSTGDALEVFSNALAFEIVTSVEPAAKLTTTWGQLKRRGALVSAPL
jgi:hypothetical protein